MSDDKSDRRVQRTRDLLRGSLIELIREKGYDAITIQDIVDRANVGRTTFYAHYQSKDDLLLDHYTDFASHMVESPQTRDDLLGDEPSAETIRFLQSLSEGRVMYQNIMTGKDAELIVRGAKLQLAHNLRESLELEFPEREPAYPLELVVNYVISGQFALMDWWLTRKTNYTPEEIARLLHDMRRSALYQAYGIRR